MSIFDNQPGSPYPSTVSASNLTGTISKVTVRLNGLSHTYPDDLDIALVGPGGQAVMLMSDAGGGGDINGLSLTFDPAASATLPDSSQLSSGVFRPTNYGTTDSFPAPAPAGSYGTSLDAFNGLAPNGTWRLYIVDDAGQDAGSLAQGWVLTIATTGAPAPDSTPDAFYFTDVTSVAVGSAQVSNPVTIAGIDTAAPISVTGGQYSIGCSAGFTTTSSTISNGQSVCVRHTSAATTSTSINTTLTVGGVADTFTSTTVGPVTPPGSGGSVVILDNQPGSPYPSTASISNLTGTIAKVTVKLNGLSHTFPDDLDIALVGPGGQAVRLMSDAGGGGNINGLSLTFDQAAASTLSNGGQLASGVFRPTNYGTTDAFPTPAPAGNYGTNLGVFNGLPPNGNWSLFIVDDGVDDVGSLAAGWVLTITTQ